MLQRTIATRIQYNWNYKDSYITIRIKIKIKTDPYQHIKNTCTKIGSKNRDQGDIVKF